MNRSFFSIKLLTFAPAYKARAFSSAGLEHLPYKQRVGGSNPSTPTKNECFTNQGEAFFCYIETKINLFGLNHH